MQPSNTQNTTTTAADDPMQRFTPEEAAEYLGVTVGTLGVWRSTGRTGGKPVPAYVKPGRSVSYLKKDLDAYILATRVEKTTTT